MRSPRIPLLGCVPAFVGNDQIARQGCCRHSSQAQLPRPFRQVPWPGLYHRAMNPITLSWEEWRAVIAVLREKGLPYMLEHADYLEQQLERHGPDEPTVRLSLTDDVFLRSYNWARVQLEIPLPVD
jgi:hypothetical protein